MDYKEINDYELLYMVCDDDYSLELLLEKYKPFINQKLFRYVDYLKKYSIDVEDLRQEVYLTVIHAIKNYDDNSNACFYTYLNVLIEHKISNFWRDQFSSRNSIFLNAVSLSTLVSDNLNLGDLIADNSEKTEDILLEKNVVEEVFNFCYGLSLEEAYVFELYLNGYSRENISILLNITYKRSAYLIFKIKNKLKKYMLKNELLVI